MDGGDAIYQNIKINEFFKKTQYPLKKINPISIRAPFQGSWLALCAVTYICRNKERTSVPFFLPGFCVSLADTEPIVGGPGS